MTPAEEARFIELWNAGTEMAAIAQTLGIPVGTVGSRAHALRQQGKIQARPKGGAHPRQKAQARQAGTPAITTERVSVQTPGVPEETPPVSKQVSKRVPTGVSQGVPLRVLPSSPPTAGASDMTPLLHDILQELRTLTQGLAGRVPSQTPPVSTQTPQVPERVSREVSLAPREKTERWNLHLPIDLITKTKAKAEALDVHPSELVAEILRRWLAEEA